MKAKPITSSKTIRVGGLYVSLGVLVGILQIFDMLETVMVSINAENVSPGVATWAGVGLAIIGGVQIWLRMVTFQPIGKKPETAEDSGTQQDSQVDKASGS